MNNEEFRSIIDKIDRARGELQDIQEKIITNYNDGLLEQERTVLHQLEKWSLIEESILKQQSRARWIKLGDSNSKYFPAMLKERNQRKQIKELTSLDGQQLNDADMIKHEIMEFYKSLMGTAALNLLAINREIIKQGLMLSQQQRSQLIAEISDQEIFEGLQSIGDDKSPGVDSFNTYFFKKTWPITKDEICAAVNEFFTTGKLYKALNCTTLTLIPKVDKPVTVKDFRPIACCTLLYKTISEVLAARLQKVIANNISENQAGFIPGRRIADNIILAYELVKAYIRKHISDRCMIKIDLHKAYD